MKIDLHIHTKSILSGENEKRNIDAKNFVKKMVDHNIGIAAITNHNIFDSEQFKEIEKEIKTNEEMKDFILLPGVELDIWKNEKRVQLNIIVPPEKKEELGEKILELEKEPNKKLSYEKMKKKFDNKDWILYLDYKSGETKWHHKDIKKLRNEIKNGIVIADTNNAQTRLVLKSHKFDALIGSDVKDWDKYGEASEKLLDTQLHIKDYKNFIKILRYGFVRLENIFSKLNKKTIKEIEMDEGKYKIENLEIWSGVNIIFGEKNTGKTEILKQIKKDLNHKAISYYSSEGPKKNYENLIEKINKNTNNKNFFDKKIEEFKKIVENIKSYKEKTFTNFHKFYLGYKDNQKNILFLEKYDCNFITPNNFKYENENITSLTKKLNEAYNKIKEIKFDEKIKENWTTSTKEIIEELWKKYIEQNKEKWKKKFHKSIKKRIEKILKKYKGLQLIPGKIGLIDRYNQKKQFILDIKDIKNFKKEEEEEIKKDFVSELPGREEVFAKKIINFLEFGENDEKKLKFAKCARNKTDLKNFNTKIKEIKYTNDFSEIKNEFEKIVDKVLPYKEKIEIVDKDNKSNFSSGEKSYLCLSYILDFEKNKDYFLLDEPEVYLGSKLIVKNLLKKISELVLEKKTIVIVTHNSTLAINTIPTQYIFRKYNNTNTDERDTFIGSIWENKFTEQKNKSETLDFSEQIIKNFEGSKKHFEFRKEIYEDER